MSEVELCDIVTETENHPRVYVHLFTKFGPLLGHIYSKSVPLVCCKSPYTKLLWKCTEIMPWLCNVLNICYVNGASIVIIFTHSSIGFNMVVLPGASVTKLYFWIVISLLFIADIYFIILTPSSIQFILFFAI